MNYPETPGYKKSGTSEDAADSMKEKAPSLCDKIMEFLVENDHVTGYTADEVADFIGETWNAIRPRFSSLSRPHPITKAPAKIYDTNIRRRNESGRMATVWRAV